MFAHLQDCLSARVAGSTGKSEALLVLRAQASGVPAFWLDVAVKRAGKLKDIDRLLRHVWLECCGHMSEFSSGTQRKVSMNTNVGEAFGSVDRLGYVYDSIRDRSDERLTKK